MASAAVFAWIPLLSSFVPMGAASFTLSGYFVDVIYIYWYFECVFTLKVCLCSTNNILLSETDINFGCRLWCCCAADIFPLCYTTNKILLTTGQVCVWKEIKCALLSQLIMVSLRCNDLCSRLPPLSNKIYNMPKNNLEFWKMQSEWRLSCRLSVSL